MEGKKKRLTMVGIVLILICFLSGSNLKAESTVLMEAAGSSELFIDTLEKGTMDRSADPTIIRTRFVKINFDLLPSPANVREGNTDFANFLDLDLFGGEFYRAALDCIETNRRGSTSWVGHLEEVPESEVILVYKDGILAGNISLPWAFYQVRFAGNGVYAVNKLDHSKFPPCGLDESQADTQSNVHDDSTSVHSAPMADSGSSIDVMVVYNQAARIGAGGTNAMETEINLAIKETNKGYSNSAITQRINLVHTAEVAYTESGNIETDLNRLKGTSDGYMDEVHSLRNTYGADCVVMVTENGGGYCGVGYLMTSVSTSFENRAFCVVRRSCATGNYSFGHELGHIMAARHDRLTDPTDNSPYAFNHGYAYLNLYPTPVGWRTIMAYDTLCNSYGYACTRLNYWSNPNINYYGVPMGVPSGDPEAADNHKTLNKTAYTVANFRAHISGPGASITVTSPNGGETLTVGSTHTVTWTSTGTVGKVKIQYSTNNGSSWSTAVSSTANDGSHSWTVPNEISTKCKVKISEASDGSPSDTSDAVFSIIEDPGSPTLSVISPNGGENLESGTTHTITWSSTGTVGNVKIRYSINNGSSWSTVVSSTANDGSYSWTVPGVDSSKCLVKISEASDDNPSDSSDAVFTIYTPTPPEISLSRTQMFFGADTSGTATSSQVILIENSGGGILDWSISSDVSWLNSTPASGTNAGVPSISVNPAGLGTGTYSGTLTVTAPDASNSPQGLPVTLQVYKSGTTSAPFGDFATPTHGSTVRSSIPVTGWVVDDIEVVSVKIYNGSNYVGDGVFVEGPRPDVEQAYPTYPKSYQAGWGYMMLTNFLPNGGNGTYTIYAKATDAEGHTVTLGSKTITCDNANAVKPFGAIDTPGQGGIASGNRFVNWGWVLTPQPNAIPTDGSTINVYVDGVNLGHPTYNNYRADIATLFPGYANSDGAAGFFHIDTSEYENGLHTIQWTATDSGGNTDGIGSRYFTIQNIGGSTSQSQNARQNIHSTGDINLSRLPVDHYEHISVKTGYGKFEKPQEIYPDDNGYLNIQVKELDRVEIHFYIPISNISPLPVGAALDAQKGIFYWGLGPGFLGDYELVFVDARGFVRKVNITVAPK